MANQEHLEILKQGVETWNEWRKSNPDVPIDLMDTNLMSTDLHSANLWGANLTSTFLHLSNLTGTNLIGADLRFAHLPFADLSSANLSGANLAGAELYGAHFIGTHLVNAYLEDADLRFAELRASNLGGADLSNAKLLYTVFGAIDLSQVKGLETMEHNGPSTIGIDTVYLSKGNIPEAFLKGAGVNDTFITYIRSLVGKPIQYYSCFISYSNKDEAFAKRLYADLQSHNVRCWYAPEDLKIGDKFRLRIDESIRIYDKLLLVLSEDSLASTWVSYEVEKALNKEPEGIPKVLFPIRLDKAILTCETDWATDIRKSRHIGDFEHWKDHDAYQIAFERLLRDLKAQS